MTRAFDLRRYLAVAALSAFAVYELTGVGMAYAFERKAMFAFFGATLAVAAIGVAKRQFWARLLALGGSIGGLLQFGAFSLAGYPSAGLSLFALLSAAVTAALIGRGMSRHMDGGTYEGDIWRDEGTYGRALGAGVIMSVAAVPVLLLVSGWGLPTPVAIALAMTFGLAALLLAFRKTAGLLLLFPASALTAGFTGDLALRMSGIGQSGMGLDWKDFVKDLILRWLDGKILFVFLAVLAVVAVVTLIVCLVFAVPLTIYLKRKKHEEEAAESE